MTDKVLFVGIDVSRRTNAVCRMGDAGQLFGQTTDYANNQPGAEKLEADLVALATEQGITQIRIGVEATSYYHFHLMDYLASSLKLKPFQVQVYPFNPKWVRHFKKAYSDMDKTDPDDAFVIADRVRFGRLPAPYREAQRNYLPLQRLTRFRYHLIDQLVREKHHFLLHLFLKLSSFTQLKPFSDTLGVASAEVITQLSAEQIAQMPMEDLVTFIGTHGKQRFPDPQHVVQTLQRVGQESYRLRPALASTITLVLATSWKNIRFLQQSVKAIDQAIAAEVGALAEYPILNSIPGIGPVYAAGLLAEIAGIDRFPSHAALAKFTGLWWKRTQSGDFEAEITRLAKSGNKYLRYYFVEGASSVIRHLASFQAYYDKKYHEVAKFQHQRALVLTARKLVRLVFALLHEGRLFRPERVPQSQGGQN